MDRYCERQTELLCYLNDNMVEPTEHTKGIAELFDIEFVDTEEQHGWILSETEEHKCPYCKGFGYTSEHDTHPHPDGDCLGRCPVAVQCEKCEATGKVRSSVLQDYDEQNKKTESEEFRLPF